MGMDLVEKVQNKNYDLIILLKTDTLNPKVVGTLNQYGDTWYFFMDSKEVAHKINAFEYMKQSKYSSATFSDVVEHSNFMGNNTKWITQGFDPDVFKFKHGVQKDIDIFFAGTKTRERNLLVQKIRDQGFNIVCYGHGWNRPPVYHHQLVDLYNRSKLVLNFCRDGNGFSVRVFQVMATKAVMVSEYCQDLDFFFRNNIDIVWFNSKDDMLKKIRKLIVDTKTREKVAQNGFDLVTKKHSWESVLKKIINCIENCDKQ